MSNKTEFINESVRIYRSLAALPSLTSAQIVNTSGKSEYIKILSNWSQKNIEQGEVTHFRKHHVLKVGTYEIVYDSVPVDISNRVLSSFSKTDNFECVVRELERGTEKKQFLEIWNHGSLYRNFDVSAFDVHGNIYTDVEFASLEWSPEENKVMYIAEKKNPKRFPFYTQAEVDKFVTPGDEYLYRPDWGEQLVGKHQPVVAICDLKMETLNVLGGIPGNFSPGQVFWAKDGKGIYGVVWENEPRRLGLTYCTNRVSYIFYLSLNMDFSILSDLKKSVRSPRLSLEGRFIYWLQRPAGGPHDGCSELVRFDTVSRKAEVLIQIMARGNDKFSGLYMHNLPRRCFSKDGTKVFFSSVHKYAIVPYYYDIATKQIQQLDTGEGSSSILDVYEDIILIRSGSLKKPHNLRITKFSPKSKWTPITKPDLFNKDTIVKEMDLHSHEPSQKFTLYNALYYGPQHVGLGQLVPLIVNPHGGPHSVTTNDFLFEPNFFVALGFGVLMVNYRGSLGMGQEGVNFLLGKISSIDVKDNHDTVLEILKTYQHLDSHNVFLFGKSHGGFLVGQLSAQYPDFYRAVVSLNPVVDVYSMYVMSDIPDWAMTECDFAFDESNPVTVEQAQKMIISSPAYLSSKIVAPTLFMLGKKDLRVPHYEGLLLHNALKAKKVKTRLFLYDDNHTLGRVPTNMDLLINSAMWFVENKS